MNSIAKAKEQFSGSKPSMIYVDLNSIDRQMTDVDFERLHSMVKQVLANNSTISAVIITNELFLSDPQGITFRHKAKVTKNEAAKHVVPFKIVGESLV